MNQNIFRRLQGAKPKYSVEERRRTLTFAKGRRKKERDYGSGREDMANETKKNESSAAEYLHFGRLIGEKTEESERKLKSKAVDIEKDDRAKLYMEKWQNEEEVSYSMFETMLGSSAEGLSRADALSFEQIVSGDYGADSGTLEEQKYAVQELQGKPSRGPARGESNNLQVRLLLEFYSMLFVHICIYTHICGCSVQLE